MLYRVAAGGPIVNYSHLVHRRSAAFTYSWQFPNKIHRFVRERLHGAENAPFFSSNFTPYEIDFSESALITGPFQAHVDAP